MSKVYVTKEFEFEAAHKLPNYDGACGNLHGHSYKLQVTVSGNVSTEQFHHDPHDSMVMDFKDLKNLVKEVILSTHDHGYLNDYYSTPTAEVMVVHMFNTLKDLLPKDVKIECVRLWETSTSFAEYRGESDE